MVLRLRTDTSLEVVFFLYHFFPSVFLSFFFLFSLSFFDSPLIFGGDLVSRALIQAGPKAFHIRSAESLDSISQASTRWPLRHLHIIGLYWQVDEFVRSPITAEFELGLPGYPGCMTGVEPPLLFAKRPPRFWDLVTCR